MFNWLKKKEILDTTVGTAGRKATIETTEIPTRYPNFPNRGFLRNMDDNYSYLVDYLNTVNEEEKTYILSKLVQNMSEKGDIKLGVFTIPYFIKLKELLDNTDKKYFNRRDIYEKFIKRAAFELKEESEDIAYYIQKHLSGASKVELGFCEEEDKSEEITPEPQPTPEQPVAVANIDDILSELNK